MGKEREHYRGPGVGSFLLVSALIIGVSIRESYFYAWAEHIANTRHRVMAALGATGEGWDTREGIRSYTACRDGKDLNVAITDAVKNATAALAEFHKRKTADVSEPDACVIFNSAKLPNEIFSACARATEGKCPQPETYADYETK